MFYFYDGKILYRFWGYTAEYRLKPSFEKSELNLFEFKTSFTILIDSEAEF